MITQTDANKLFRQGNDAGMGYAPYADVPGDDTIEAAVAAAEADGWELVLASRSTSDVTVLRNGDGELMAIGDANGPWAVIISDIGGAS